MAGISLLRSGSAPYALVSLPHGEAGAKRLVARYTCEGCTRSVDVTTRPTHGISIDEHRKKLMMRGFVMNSRGVISSCPNCAKKEPDMAAVKNAPAPAEVQTATPALSVVTAASIEPISPTAMPWPVMPSSLPSAEQRIRIRAAIETHFDDGQGMYLGGESDQSIAEKLRMPRAWIEMIRETAYGPIRITPEMQALKAEIAAAQEMIDGLRKRVDAMERAAAR